MPKDVRKRAVRNVAKRAKTVSGKACGKQTSLRPLTHGYDRAHNAQLLLREVRWATEEMANGFDKGAVGGVEVFADSPRPSSGGLRLGQCTSTEVARTHIRSIKNPPAESINLQ